MQIRVRQSPLCDTTIAAAAAQNDSPVTLTTVVGLYPGSVVSISRAGVQIARQRVIAVDHAQSQIELTGGAAAALQVGDTVVSQEVRLIVELLGTDGKVNKDEAFDNLAMDPRSSPLCTQHCGCF